MIVSSEEIVKTLLEEGFWAFTKRAPFQQSFKSGDHVIIYVGGKGRHNFSASVVIKDALKTPDEHHDEILKRLSLNFLHQIIEFSEINVFKDPVKIHSMFDDLEFITDKKNYGLHLRLPVRKISKSDYYTIVNAGHD